MDGVVGSGPLFICWVLVYRAKEAPLFATLNSCTAYVVVDMQWLVVAAAANKQAVVRIDTYSQRYQGCAEQQR
jgi:hypothetical protein